MAPRTVFITGTSSGIGLASAVLFHRQGWNVAAAMRSPEKAPVELKALDASRLLILPCDVTDLSSIERAASATLQKFEGIDWVVNNAGFGLLGVFEGLPREKVLEQLNTNVIGLMDVTRTFLPHLRQKAKSADKYTVGIINVSSGGGIWTLPHSSLYCTSKFAVEGFTEALTYELSSQNIYAKLVVPHGGIAQTAFNERVATEVGNSGAKDEVAEAYKAFMEKTAAAFGKMGAGVRSTSEDVAKTILESATDRTDKLRYFIGNDVRGFLKLRYGEKGIAADEEYVTGLRSYFDY